MGIATTRTHLGEQFSEGARLLWAAMAERDWSQGQLAKAIGAKPGVVPRWLYGDTKPSWEWAVILRDVLGIALEAWTLAPVEEFVPPAARDVDSSPSLDADDSGAHAAPRPTGTS